MKWLIAAAMAAALFFGISAMAPEPPRTCACGGPGLDRETATAIALRDTPLRQVDNVDSTRDLTNRTLITGRDEAGRVIVVWVQPGVPKTAYMDELIPAHGAMALAEAAGLKLGTTPSAALQSMVETDGPVFWRVSNGPQVVNIDAKTGAVLSTIGGVVPHGAHD